MSKFELINRENRLEKCRGDCALGIMTKAPEPGKVKTRLTPPLTAIEAAALNSCFLRDLSQSISLATKQAPARAVAIYTPPGQEEVYDDILPADFLLIPQRGNAFGDRLIFAAADVFAAGFGSVCLINSDSPTVPASEFAEAANELAKSGDRIVLGPSDDRGYYLIGLKQLHRRVFEEIDWSTERVFEQTLARTKEIHVPVHRLANGLDVDGETSLRQLCNELLREHAPPDVAPHTRAFLQELSKRSGPEGLSAKLL